MQILYLDASGSIQEPQAKLVLEQVKKLSIPNMRQFGNRVHPMNSIKDYSPGELGGTDLNEVIADAKKSRATEITIITDGYCEPVKSPAGMVVNVINIYQLPKPAFAQ
jgi:hypothetical protein